jgi:hypothetical protein
MPSNGATFSGLITQQFQMVLADQPNHAMSIVEVSGTQRSADPLWDNSKITYWGMTELLDGKGTQRGCFNNVHPGNDRDWGTFEGTVTATGDGISIEGTYKLTGGDGRYQGIKGDGKFKVFTKSETEIECSWQGTYEMALAPTR